tara:strand:+ start:574 stop:1866 length:1293 start_codon:yes stop_codon:yes gene_type:complete
MPSYSTNLNLAKPTVGGDTNQWGGYLNTNTDTLDGIFNAAGTGTSVGLQVGSGKTLKVGGTLTATGTIQLTGDQNLLKFYESEGGGDNFVGIMAPQQMSGNTDYSLVLPAAQGTVGQFLKLTSLSGSIGLLQFADVISTTINNNADDRVITGSGTANTLNGEANLRFSGGTLIAEGDPSTVLGQSYSLALVNSVDSSTSGSAKTGILFKANYTGTTLTDMAGITGGKENLTDGDYGSFLSFSTRTNGVNSIAERMRIDSSGVFKINSTLGGLNSQVVLGFGATTKGMLMYDFNSGSGTTFIQFRNGALANTTLGEITRNSSNNAINYNTTSDYRLKTNIEEKTDGIEKIKQLKVKKFNWKSNVDNNKVDGFIAHEVSPIVPEAITGEKDGEEMQGIDQSKLVPLITAALQEAITKIESLESEIDQLKGVN